MKYVKTPSHLLSAILLSSLLACANVEQNNSELDWVDSSAEIASLSSFLVIGETRRETVIEVLGAPISFTEFPGVESELLYQWRTAQYEEGAYGEEFQPREDVGSDFNGIGTHHYAYLYLKFRPDSVLKEKIIAGP